jgi:hypothetical protein
MRDRVTIAGALAQRPGVGGHASVFVQWLLGFQRTRLGRPLRRPARPGHGRGRAGALAGRGHGGRRPGRPVGGARGRRRRRWPARARRSSSTCARRRCCST